MPSKGRDGEGGLAHRTYLVPTQRKVRIVRRHRIGKRGRVSKVYDDIFIQNLIGLDHIW